MFAFYQKNKFILLLSFIILSSILAHLNIFTLELMGHHVWRQTQTQINITNFYRYDNCILNPTSNLHDMHGNPILYRMEFPIMQWLIAQSYRVFGESIVVSRISLFLIGIGSTIGMFGLVNRLLKNVYVSFFVAWAFTFSPLFYYYTMNIIPDNLALCCMIWSLYFFVKYREVHTRKDLMFSAFFLCMAALAKLPFILVGISYILYFISLFFQKLSKKSIYQILFIGASYLLFILPAFAWYGWVIPTWENPLLSNHNFKDPAVFNKALDIVNFHLNRTFPVLLIGKISLVFFFASLIAILKYKFYKKAFAWSLFAGLLLVTSYFLYEIIPIDKVHDYYTMPFFPYLFLIIATGVKLFYDTKYLRYLLIPMGLGMPFLAAKEMNHFWTVEFSYVDPHFYASQKELKSIVPNSEKVIILNDFSGHIIPYLIDKKGFVFGYDDLPKERLASLISEKGVKYMYCNSRNYDGKPEIKPFLDSLLLERGSIRVYSLTTQKSN